MLVAATGLRRQEVADADDAIGGVQAELLDVAHLATQLVELRSIPTVRASAARDGGVWRATATRSAASSVS